MANLLVRDSTKQNPTVLTMDTHWQIIAQLKTQNKITTGLMHLKFSLAFILTHTHKKKNQQIVKYLHDLRLGAKKYDWWVRYD